MHIPSCYCCQLGQVNKRTSALRSILSPKTAPGDDTFRTERGIPSSVVRGECFFMMFHQETSTWAWKRQGRDHLLVFSLHHSRQCQTDLFVWAKQQPGAVLEERLCISVWRRPLRRFTMSDSTDEEGVHKESEYRKCKGKLERVPEKVHWQIGHN